MKADYFLELLLKKGFGPFIGVPCSIVKDLISGINGNPKCDYYAATSEGEAMGMAAGFGFCGKIPVVIMQNDGFGNAVNPITSLHLLYDLPALMIITWRGEPGAAPDAPQHSVMGKIILDLLNIIGIPYSILNKDGGNVNRDIECAEAYIKNEKRPYALIAKRGLFEKMPSNGPASRTAETLYPLRADYIRMLDLNIDPNDIILATTGFTGRELYQESGRKSKFYMAGSMGCVPSIGLGVAIERPSRKVYVLDGDGALLMKMGTLAVIGRYSPKNLTHIVFDNGVYESTGGQKTVSGTVNFSQIALNSGYRYAESVDALDEFVKFLETRKNMEGPMMCHIKVKPGTLNKLSRPVESPVLLKERFITHMAGMRKR